jgi:hypothetical protein
VNGSSSTSAVSSVGLPSRLRSHSVATANTAPMASPTNVLRSSSTAPCPQVVCSPWTAPTAMANTVSAVASLTRLSPVRIEVTRLGRPISSPWDTVVIVSGGARIAPSTKAAAPIEGSSHAPTSPSRPLVSSTSTTPSVTTGPRLEPNALNDEPRVAE